MRAEYPTVLVADDDPRMRDLITLPDICLTITDIVMPDMNGYDLTDEILKVRPDMRLVFMSGFAADPLRRVVSAPCLPKPFTVEELLTVVDEALKDAP